MRNISKLESEIVLSVPIHFTKYHTNITKKKHSLNNYKNVRHVCSRKDFPIYLLNLVLILQSRVSQVQCFSFFELLQIKWRYLIIVFVCTCFIKPKILYHMDHETTRYIWIVVCWTKQTGVGVGGCWHHNLWNKVKFHHTKD